MIQGPQLIIVLAIILLLFGGSKLPKLARSLGQAQKEFRDGLKDGQEDDDAPAASAPKTDTGNAASSNPASSNPASTSPASANPGSTGNQPSAGSAPPADETSAPASTPGDDDTSRNG